MSVDSTSDRPTHAWRSLRDLLAEQGPKPKASLQLAEVARMAEVEHLALHALPELSPWLDAPAQRRTEAGVLVHFAEEKVCDLLAEAGVERWVALKGSASAHLLYSDPLHRTRRDVDILVHPKDMVRVSEAAHSAGWTETTHQSHTLAAQEGPFEREFAIHIGEHRVGLDIHQSLLRWREFKVDTEGIIARAHQNTRGWRICDPLDLLLHSALHAGNAALRVPLRSILDIHLLARTLTRDWRALNERATSWRSRSALWLCLSVSQRWFGTSIPEDVLEALRPPRLIARHLESASAHEGRFASGHLKQSALKRTWLRALLRDSPQDTLRYLLQLSARELAQLRGRA